MQNIFSLGSRKVKISRTNETKGGIFLLITKQQRTIVKSKLMQFVYVTALAVDAGYMSLKPFILPKQLKN